MRGKIFTIEGLDGSGKATQSKKLYDHLSANDIPVSLYDFPNYHSDSSFLVKEYLGGAFGQDYKKIDGRTTSVFYALDRLLTYQNDIKEKFERGTNIIFDRYTTANLLHQAMKYDDRSEEDQVLDWIEHFEYEILGLPKPDLVFFLKVPYEYSFENLKNKEKNDGSIKQDIHERSIEFLKKSYDNGIYVSQKYNWNVIECFSNGGMRPIDSIHDEIYQIVQRELK